MNVFLILGYIASGNACLMMMPQVYLSFKKKKIEDLSMQTIYMNLLTQILFFPYSTHFKLYPLITVNSFLALCDILLISLHCYLKNKQNVDIHETSTLNEIFIDSEESAC
tara:strand:- start:345 stop:674 length:330 start_codon:yes stop_codon:yes gene_type:complete